MTDTRTAQTSFIPHLRFSKRRVRDIHAPALPAEFIGAAGVLGVDSLARQRVVFDFANRTMTITTSSPEREKWSPDTIVITGRSLYGRLVLTDARIDGEKIVAIIDTGSELTIGNEALRKRLLAKKRLGRTVPFQLRSLTGQVFNVDYAPVGRVTLGGVAIDDMAIGFADAHPFKHLRLTNTPAIMLGMDALRLFSRVSVDFARKEVRLMLPGSATLDGQTLLALSRVGLGNGSN